MKTFQRPGPINTNQVVDAVKKALSTHKYVVVASITGDSALRVAGRIRNKKIICVTCPNGMNWEVDKMTEGPFAAIPELRKIRSDWARQGLSRVPMEISRENGKCLKRLGVDVVRGTIPFFGPTFSMRVHLQKVTDVDLMAKTLELISTGTLVCLESVLMAVDAGRIPEGEIVVAAAGTERGLDTAWTIKASASASLFHPSKGARFVQLLAKPGLSLMPDVGIEYLR